MAAGAHHRPHCTANTAGGSWRAVAVLGVLCVDVGGHDLCGACHRCLWSWWPHCRPHPPPSSPTHHPPQTLLSKQEWLNKPEMPQGVTEPGLLELAASAVESRRRLASGSGAAVDASSAAAADKSSPNGSTTLVNAETS